MRVGRAVVAAGALALAGFAGGAGPGCSGRRATAADCRSILDRIVELEIRERGFRDDALVARKREELATLFSAELRHCQGRTLPQGALACVREAKTSEAISHRCLR